MKNIRIEKLTEDQVDMLNFMWNELETTEEFLEWYESLDAQQQADADTLQHIIILECMEDMLQDTTQATEYLKRFQLQ